MAKINRCVGVGGDPEFWQRDRHQPLEIYKLVNGTYQLQIGEPHILHLFY